VPTILLPESTLVGLSASVNGARCAPYKAFFLKKLIKKYEKLFQSLMLIKA